MKPTGPNLTDTFFIGIVNHRAFRAVAAGNLIVGRAAGNVFADKQIPMESKNKHLRVDRKEIAFMRFVLEACDGIAVVRTVDAKAGLVVLHVAPGCETEVDRILEDLKDEMMIEEVYV